ncbi:MAG: PIN domain-containing protein [Candidatus Poribacteria bacterium]|nr:PIN domain-containing protein [Candidatus Poribacteria bacterium]
MQNQFQNLKIYLDTCCLSRLFDNQTQERIQQETQAIAAIIGFFATNWQWVISDFLMVEVLKNPNSNQRNMIKDLLNYAHHTVYVSEQEVLKAIHFELLSFKIEDALHLACAERGNADVFLTTDDKLVRKTKSVQARNKLSVQVENPYTWLQEVLKNEHPSNTK